MILAFLANPFSSLRRGVNKLVARIGLFAAIALAGGSVAGSFFVPTKAVGVFLAAIGCFAAGWMFCAFFAKAIGLAKEEGSSEKKLEEELRKTKEAKASAENRAAELENENARLKNQRIDINAVRPVLKLGLVEAEMSVKDVKVAWMNDFDSEGMGPIKSIYHATRSQYVGVLERSFKAAYGVDLMKLKIREEDNRIRVVGIEPESLGFKDDETTWLVRQTQTYRLKATNETDGGPMPAADPATGFKSGEKYYEIDRAQPFKGSLDLNKTATFCERQEKELARRLNNGVGEDFRSVNFYIRQMAEGFIRMLLAPVKKPVEFDPIPTAQIEGESGWLALEDYAKEYNRKLDAPSETKSRLE